MRRAFVDVDVAVNGDGDGDGDDPIDGHPNSAAARTVHVPSMRPPVTPPPL
jgi:hypothetical protein